MDALHRAQPCRHQRRELRHGTAYIADVSDDENRAKNFGLIGIAFGTGFALGPVIGGFLGELGPRVPFYGAAALSFLNFIMGVFLLPETLAPANRRRFEWHRANPLGALKQMRHYPGIGWVGLVFFLYWLAHAVYPAVWSFVGSYRYGWSEGQIGLSLGIFGVAGAIVMAWCSPVSCRHWEKGVRRHSGSPSRPSGWRAMRPPGRGGWSTR